jgi:hypothetical protein
MGVLISKGGRERWCARGLLDALARWIESSRKKRRAA